LQHTNNRLSFVIQKHRTSQLQLLLVNKRHDVHVALTFGSLESIQSKHLINKPSKQ
jgi:uncharacterized membrane protein YwzB